MISWSSHWQSIWCSFPFFTFFRNITVQSSLIELISVQCRELAKSIICSCKLFWIVRSISTGKQILPHMREDKLVLKAIARRTDRIWLGRLYWQFILKIFNFSRIKGQAEVEKIRTDAFIALSSLLSKLWSDLTQYYHHDRLGIIVLVTTRGVFSLKILNKQPNNRCHIALESFDSVASLWFSCVLVCVYCDHHNKKKIDPIDRWCDNSRYNLWPGVGDDDVDLIDTFQFLFQIFSG